MIERQRYYNRVGVACGYCLWKYGTIQVLECPTLDHDKCLRRGIDPNHRGPCTRPCGTPQPDGRRCRFHAFHFRKCEPIGVNRDEGFVSAVQPRKRTRSGGASTSTA